MERADALAAYGAALTILRLAYRSGLTRDLEAANRIIDEFYALIGLDTAYCEGCDGLVPRLALDAKWMCPDCHEEVLDSETRSEGEHNGEASEGDGPTVPREEYDRLAGELSAVQNQLASAKNEIRLLEEELSWRGAFRGWLRRLCRAGGYGLVGVALVYVVWWSCIKDVAWGAAARHNAEEAAINYAARRFGGPAESVWCEDNHTGQHPLFLICYARYVGRTEPQRFFCDDDQPASNDGCASYVERP